QLAFGFDNGIGSAVLIAKGMAANDDGCRPVGYQAGNIIDNNRLAEHGSVEDIADGAVGAFPHLFQAEFFYTRFVGRDGSAFNAYAVLFDGIGGIDGYLVVGLVAVLHAE